MSLTLDTAALVTDEENELSSIGSDDDPGSRFPRCSDGNGTLSHLFFSDDDYELARAKAICGPCGLKESCLSGAVAREEPYGIWGGKLVLDGVCVDAKPTRGRPRKHPLPILVVDEAPIPAHLVA
jgi:WhiB family redox-sensing transcriptional regulator